jgi:hypothetical protein
VPHLGTDLWAGKSGHEVEEATVMIVHTNPNPTEKRPGFYLGRVRPVPGTEQEKEAR